jgi:hypothetical protein
MNYSKQKLSLALLVGSAISLSGCEKLVGSGTINQRTEAYTRGVGSKTIILEPGSYDAEIMFQSKTSRVTLKGAQTLQFKINTPAELARDGYKRDFSYSAAQLNQAFGLQGDADVKYSRGRTYNKSETCVLGTRREAYRYCYPDERRCISYGERCYRRPNGNVDCFTECRMWENTPGRCEMRYRIVTDYGTQTVSGYDQISQETMTIKLKASNSNVLGTLNFAEPASTNFVRTQTGPCL